MTIFVPNKNIFFQFSREFAVAQVAIILVTCWTGNKHFFKGWPNIETFKERKTHLPGSLVISH